MVDDKNRVNRIEFDNDIVYIYPGLTIFPYECPVSQFLGDRLYDWKEYLQAHPNLTENEVPEYDYDFPHHFNTYDFHFAFYLLSNFLRETDYLKSRDTLKHLEMYRMKYGITLDCQVKDNKYIYRACETMAGILFATVHFYALNGYKLQLCRHCEKYFASKDGSFKYCDRISPCYNLVVAGKPLLRNPSKCEPAVRTIRQRFTDRKKTIYSNWYINRSSDEVNELLNKCSELFFFFDDKPTVKNITTLQQYLYSDEMPKQERPNRRKTNAEKRKLLGR